MKQYCVVAVLWVNRSEEERFIELTSSDENFEEKDLREIWDSLDERLHKLDLNSVKYIKVEERFYFENDD